MTTPDSPAALAAWLASRAAAPARQSAVVASSQHPEDPLAAAAALRHQLPDLPPAAAAACLEQAALRHRARSQYGLEEDLLLTRDGLEAATRREVADRRARRIAASGARRVVDLTGGLGFDTAAFVRAGLAVTAVERDAVTATFLRHNVPAADVIEGQAADLLPQLLTGLASEDVVFVDPARRDPAAARDARTARARPELWSPPWSWVETVPHPRVLAKVAPGFPPPADWWAEWISVERTVVECTVASWPIAPVRRSAVAFVGVGAVELGARPDGRAKVSPPAAWMHEPDPAVVRADALDTLALDEDLSRLDAESTWLTGDSPSTSWLLRSYEVLAQLSGSHRQQRRVVAGLGVARASVKSRDARVDGARLLKELGLTEGPDAVLIVTRRGGRTISLLARPVAQRGR